MGDDKNYTNVILEEIRSQMSAVLEIVSNQPTREEFNNLREEFDSLKTDVRTIKRAVVVDNDKTTRHELELLDQRVTKLEENAS